MYTPSLGVMPKVQVETPLILDSYMFVDLLKPNGADRSINMITLPSRNSLSTKSPFRSAFTYPQHTLTADHSLFIKRYVALVAERGVIMILAAVRDWKPWRQGQA